MMPVIWSRDEDYLVIYFSCLVPCRFPISSVQHLLILYAERVMP